MKRIIWFCLLLIGTSLSYAGGDQFNDHTWYQPGGTLKAWRNSGPVPPFCGDCYYSIKYDVANEGAEEFGLCRKSSDTKLDCFNGYASIDYDLQKHRVKYADSNGKSVYFYDKGFELAVNPLSGTWKAVPEFCSYNRIPGEVQLPKIAINETIFKYSQVIFQTGSELVTFYLQHEVNGSVALKTGGSFPDTYFVLNKNKEAIKNLEALDEAAFIEFEDEYTSCLYSKAE